jgi:hypothetical protein
MHSVLDALAAQFCFRGAWMLTLASTFGAGRLELAARSLTTGFLSTLYPSSAAEGMTWLSGSPPAWLLGGKVISTFGTEGEEGMAVSFRLYQRSMGFGL